MGSPAAWLSLLIVSAVGLIIALQEFGWLPFRFPRSRRQTSQLWFARFGPVRAAWWWGIDLGSGLTTIVTFPGYWLLIIGIALNGSAAFGAFILGLYGLSRGIAVVLQPHLLSVTDLPPQYYVHSLLVYRRQLHSLHRGGLLVMGLALAISGIALK